MTRIAGQVPSQVTLPMKPWRAASTTWVNGLYSAAVASQPVSSACGAYAVVQRTAASIERVALKNATKELRERHAPGTVLPEGPILDLTTTSVVGEWHTPLTRLYRVRRNPAVVWYPGGKVGEAELRIKPAGSEG